MKRRRATTGQALDDPILEESARVDPRESFEDLVRHYQADVRILTRRHFGRSVEAEEVAQEVFVQVFRSLDSYRREGSVRAWVLGIARNQILAHIRNESRRKRRSAAVIPPEILNTHAVVEDPFAFEDAQRDLDALRGCLDLLDEKLRTVVDSFYFQQKTAESIASESNQSAGSVRMMLMRIRKRLAECIRRKQQATGMTDG